MGHETDAFIGKMPINFDKVNLYGLAVALENNFAIVFLDEKHLLIWEERLRLNCRRSESNSEFEGELIHFFAKEIGVSNYVIAKFDYEFFGVLYNNGIKEDKGEINFILQKLGVKLSDKQNEFDELNLNDYRLSEAFYWDGELNFAKHKKNVIQGYAK